MATVNANVDWRGDEVTKEVKTRVSKALNIGADVGVQSSQQDSPRRTGFMANTMEVVKRATPQTLRVVWGNQTAKYTIWVEIGARGRAGVHMIKRSLQPAAKAVHNALAK